MSDDQPERIFRYPIEITGTPHALMPASARVLSVAGERNPGEMGELNLDVWALVAPSDTNVVKREFRIVGTGHPVPTDCGRFIGTVLTHRGALVWHVFEAAGSVTA